jgi:NADH dehydrogenase (ubiquinone) Fe-S protein 4
MEVSPAIVWQQRFSLVPRSIFRHVLCGMVFLQLAPSLELGTNSPSIYKPTKTATQSGNWNASHWLMDWDVLPKGHRWENPLMGWASSADFMNGQRIQFKSKEDAINFANKQGYEYFVQEPNKRKFVPKAYANLFTHVPGKLKVVRTK